MTKGLMHAAREAAGVDVGDRAGEVKKKGAGATKAGRKDGAGGGKRTGGVVGGGDMKGSLVSKQRVDKSDTTPPKQRKRAKKPTKRN
jgi:hypothetical protein